MGARALGPASAAPHEAPEPAPHDTRDRVLHRVVEAGPVSVVDLAEHLGITTAGVRRHVTALEADGLVTEHRTPRPAGRRGRPARSFVATGRAHSDSGPSYARLAADLLDHLQRSVGPSAVEEFAARRAGELAARHRGAVERAGDGARARAEALAAGLADDGYAATVRPVPGPRRAAQGHGANGAVQLCQGHCPIREVAAQFPQFCEAETKVFAELLGVHVQRLSTIASGGHVCTTHVPTTSLATAAHAPADRPETGTGEGTR